LAAAFESATIRNVTGSWVLLLYCLLQGEENMPQRRHGKKSLKRLFEGLLRELDRELQRIYGGRLVSVVVYGSVGRGTPRPDSDVDILVIAEPLPDGRKRRMDEFGAVKMALSQRLLSLQQEGIFTTLAPIFKTCVEVRRGSLLFLDMIDDGRILFDRSGFWSGYIQDLRGRLQRLGARKIVDGQHWYWDLKPDYIIGETFEI
jgi:uncharacterized protein